MLTHTDTLLDLHSKLATVVRYYDRMLEDRLSNTYSQHNLGSPRSHIPAQSSIYPSIPSEPPNSHGGAENYYSMNGPSHNAYLPEIIDYSGHAPAQASYSQRERAPSNTSSGYEGPQHTHQVPQRASSIQQYSQSPVQRQDLQYPQRQQSRAYHQQYQPNPPDAPQIPSSKDSAAMYYNDNNHQPQVSPPQSYQSQHRADQIHGSAPSPNVSPHVQQQQQPYYTNYNTTEAAPPQQPQQLYWQQQQYAPPPQQPKYQLAHQSVNSYNPDSFPLAPNHQPQPKQVEEQLIEL